MHCTLIAASFLVEFSDIDGYWCLKICKDYLVFHKAMLDFCLVFPLNFCACFSSFKKLIAHHGNGHNVCLLDYCCPWSHHQFQWPIGQRWWLSNMTLKPHWCENTQDSSTLHRRRVHPRDTPSVATQVPAVKNTVQWQHCGHDPGCGTLHWSYGQCPRQAFFDMIFSVTKVSFFS